MGGAALALGRLSPYLNELMGERVVLCNSLSLERGSRQPMHCDSLFMTPRTEGKLIATWIALEDAHPDGGQVFYFPGSHAIPSYRFSNGSRSAIMREMPDWTAYMEKWIGKLGLTKQTFSAQCGDVLIWASDLAHGGSPIVDPKRTRRSLVCHYHSASDCDALHCDVVSAGEASWMRRPHPPLVVPEPPPAKRRGFVRRLLRELRVRRRRTTSA
jgi:phytanoyl-CoA hydroxylase